MRVEIHCDVRAGVWTEDGREKSSDDARPRANLDAKWRYSTKCGREKWRIGFKGVEEDERVFSWLVDFAKVGFR